MDFTERDGKNMYDVVALGELLVDFTFNGYSENKMRNFEQNPGGAPANVACALSLLGKKTAFIGKVGNDFHGRFLADALKEKKVDTRGIVFEDNVFTTLAFVQLSEKGERCFSFARKPGADTFLKPEEINGNLLEKCRVFHFGSLSLTNEPSRSATLKAVSIAQKNGAVISYDPNYREALWQDKQTAVEQMRSVIDKVDIIKISEEETELLTGRQSPREAAENLIKQGVKCVSVTMGSKGVYIACGSFSQIVPTFDGPVVDTTGAGDAFCGGFLSRFIDHDAGFDNFENLIDCARYGNAAATLCVSKRGAITALPDCESVENLLLQPI